MSITVKSPNSTFSGESSYGSLVLDFKDGVAKCDELPDGVRQYLQSTGYTIDGEVIEQPAAPAPVDSRDVDPTATVGTPLRDAAVDPKPSDFLAPTNAGEADPHGPAVVSPEIHASEGVRPVKPGEVHVDDTAAQDKAETAHAAAATDGTPVTDGATVDIDLAKAKKDELVAYAQASGVTFDEKATKDEIRAAIESHQNAG